MSDTPKKTVLYEVTIIWHEKVREPEVYDNIMSFRYEDEVYFFFSDDEYLPGHPGLKTIWVKNPDLVSIEILPYPLEDRS